MEKDFDRWNYRKKQLHTSTFNDFVNAREVWWCALGVNIGSEQDGSPSIFERPVVVLRKFNQDMVLAIPTTSRPKSSPFHVPFVHTGRSYAAILSQVRLISTKRLRRLIFKMDRTTFDTIRRGLQRILWEDLKDETPPLGRGISEDACP